MLSLLFAAPALAETEFYQTVDRNQVGTEETFHLTVVVSDAPEGSSLQVPASNDFEVLSKSTSTQMSYQIGAGGKGLIKQVQKYTFTMRANRAGTLTIPAAVLRTPNKALKTEPVKITSVKGHSNAPPPPGPPPRGAMPGFPNFPDPFGDDDDQDPFAGMGQPQIPRSNSDLFLVAHLDKDEAYVGEQVTLTLTAYSRVELSQIDSPKWPNLDGFWNEAIDSPTQLAPEQKVLNGVPYKAYLLKKLALFPVKPGNVTIGSIEVNITTGFLFAGGRYKRTSPPVTLKVKPLPPGSNINNVGHWRLSTQVSQTTVALGEPVQVKVIVEGKGNLKNVNLPPLTGPASLKIYDPQTTDSVNTNRGQLGGRRVMEYVVLAQQTGSFTMPGLKLDYFNPESGHWEDSKTDPVTLTITAGAGGSQVIAAPSNAAGVDPTQKNQLVASGIKSLHHTAKFEGPSTPFYRRVVFFPLAGAPLAFGLGGLALALFRRSRGDDQASARRRQARAARARLSAAEKLKASSKAAEFYAEVEKALLSFLEAKLSTPVQGLTRPQLELLLGQRGVPDAARARILAVLEASELGRFAPGMAGARQKTLDDAVNAMGLFEVDEGRRAA